jgi:hypothetical protein
MELVVMAAAEKIRLLICFNLLDALGMTTVLLQQVFESHVLTGVYRRQAAAIGVHAVRSLVDPYAVAYGEASVEDPAPSATSAAGGHGHGSSATALSSPSTMVLAIMETEETLPISLGDLIKVDQHLRLDPYLFHGYDQTLLGTSPAVTPGRPPAQWGPFGPRSSSSGMGSPGSGASNGAGTGNGTSGGSSSAQSWSARTSMISFKPGGRVRKFFHRPELLSRPLQPPSSKIMHALQRSAGSALAGQGKTGAPGGRAAATAASSKSPSLDAVATGSPSITAASASGPASLAANSSSMLGAPALPLEQKSTRERVMTAAGRPPAALRP